MPSTNHMSIGQNYSPPNCVVPNYQFLSQYGYLLRALGPLTVHIPNMNYTKLVPVVRCSHKFRMVWY